MTLKAKWSIYAPAAVLLGAARLAGQDPFIAIDSMYSAIARESKARAISSSGFTILADSDSCVLNPRERYEDRFIIYDSTMQRVGEVEKWSQCCRVELTSVRVNNVLAAYSSAQGRYLRAITYPQYEPCKSINDATSTWFRDWRLQDILELRHPLSGKVDPDFSLKAGRGHITITDTMHRPITTNRINYEDGFRHGFTYATIVDQRTGKAADRHIEMYDRGVRTGLYVYPFYDDGFIAGVCVSSREPPFIPMLHAKEYYIDKKGRARKMRGFTLEGGYTELIDIPDNGPKNLRISLGSPSEIMNQLFPEERSLSYPESWDFGEGVQVEFP